MSLQWLGGPTAVLELGPFTLLTDPVFGEGPAAFKLEMNPNTGEPNAAIARRGPLPRFARERVGLVLVSHAHADHFDARAQQELGTQHLPLVLPTAQLPVARAAGFSRAEGLDWWERRTFEAAGAQLHITAVPARHAVAPEAERFLGKGNGYWLELRQGDHVKRVFWTGDSLLSPELQELRARFGRPDLLLPHLGGVGEGGPLGRISLNAADTVELVRMLEPVVVIPLHHSTFSLYREPISELVQALSKGESASTLTLLREGERIELDR